MPNIHHFQVQTAQNDPAWAELTPILEALFPVRYGFVPGQPGNDSADCIREVVDGSTLRVHRHATTPAAGETREVAIRFADRVEVPFPFRGRSITARVPSGWGGLCLTEDEIPMATSDRGPVWTVRKEGCANHYRSSLPLPCIGKHENFADVFNGDRFIELLPLIHWTRERCNNGSNIGQLPLRACFVVDDPNLHRLQYGYVDFAEIAARAMKVHYHVAFATIPLDGWFTHQATVDIFRSNNGSLSLAIHGNDHSYCELARGYSTAARNQLLAQSIQRTENLERRSGLHICRVMIPPHGACSEEMLAALPRFGFAGACISHGSLRAFNESKSWIRTLGYLPSELIQGCPVLPRWGISNHTRNTILVAAYLNQPLILRVHHRDLKNGIELLDEQARFINDLGPVLWTGLSALCRLDSQWRMDGGKNASEHAGFTHAPFDRVSTRPTVAAMARRILTEARDRFLR